MKSWLLLSLLILPSVSTLFRPGFFPIHDNLQPLRQLQMRKCALDLQIPCRWVPDMGFGYGYPLFNYYPPLPYLIGLPLVLLSFPNLDAVKFTIAVATFLGATFMFCLLKAIFASSQVALAGSVLFTYAPYRAVDIYVRGSVNELWAITFLPAIFWSIYKICQDHSRLHVCLLSLWVAGILLSHNLTAMIFFPAACLWAIICLIKFRLGAAFFLFASACLGLGLAAFFTLPVIFERDLVHLNTLTIGYFNYLAHFVSLKQLFINPNWGYGGSQLGTADGISFFIGYLHWLLPLLSFPLLIFRRDKIVYFLAFSVISVYSSFMSHLRSSFIWGLLPILEFLQFPWRFLTIVVFSTSFLGSYIALFLNRRVLALLLGLIIILNSPFFLPHSWNESETDSSFFSGGNWQKLIQASIFDYLPKSAPYPPGQPPDKDFNLISGTGSVKLVKKNSREFTFTSDLATPGTLRVSLFYFPGWTAEVNGSKVNIYPDPADDIGRVNIDLPAGKSQIKLYFSNTPVRTIGNAISLLSLTVLAALFLGLKLKSAPHPDRKPVQAATKSP